MRRGMGRWLSPGVVVYLRYVPAIVRGITNWPSFPLDYIGLRNGGVVYVFRNGARLMDAESTLTGTIAVVFLRRHYGDVSGKNVIVDMGVNLEGFTVYAAQQLPSARIFSYEPVQRNFTLLCWNIALNNLEGRVTAANAGVASRRGERTPFISLSTLHTLVDTGEASQNTTVNCITLKDAPSSNSLDRVDLLKMNCEGAEYEILYTADDQILEKTQEIRMEYHSEDSVRNGVCGLRAFLESQGIDITHLFGNSAEDIFIWARRIR